MTLKVAQFSLKIEHLSFSMGPRGPRAYGLRPRLGLLIELIRTRSKYMQPASGEGNSCVTEVRICFVFASDWLTK